MDVYAKKLSELKNKLVCYSKLAVDMVNDSIREFVLETDGLTFLNK